MKRTLTLLLALAATAHAQFAVMHTNGVVTSPTNLNIQQSNVAGLSNALAGKLATNGTASGLTGFVGTTNAETARGNLGISNTFAGQFHADFYDDFSRYTNGTVITDGVTPLFGSAYFLSGASSGATNAPFISGGGLTSTNVFYLTSELPRPVYSFGGVVEFSQGTVSNQAVFLIQPDTQWIGRVLHIVVTPWDTVVDVSTNGVAGFGGTNRIISENYAATAPLLANVRQTITGQIQGDTLHLNVGGKTYVASHPEMTNVVGNYFTIENFYLASGLTNQWFSAWANSPTLQSLHTQPISDNLTALSRGYGEFSTRLIVGTNPSSFLSELGTNIALFNGNTLTLGQIRGRIGGNSGIGVGAPMVHQKSGGTANTNTTNLMSLVTFNIVANTLAQDWSRWSGTYVGSFANNTNDKRVTINMAGVRLDTGSLAQSGEWKVDVLVYRSTNNSHEGFAMFQSEQTTKTSRWTFNNGADVQFNITLDAAGNANNDVILRGAWSDVFP